MSTSEPFQEPTLQVSGRGDIEREAVSDAWASAWPWASGPLFRARFGREP